MKKKWVKRIGLILCLIFLCSTFTVYATDEQVKITNKEYSITLTGTDRFIGNDTPVSGKIGSKVFLTYTVDKVRVNTCSQNGVAACLNLSNRYAYEGGGGLYYGGPQLFQEGYTYVLRLERTEEGFKQECIRLKDDESERLIIPAYYGERDGNFQYFGIWFAGLPGEQLDVDLIHVRCYDEKGNDLGVYPFKAEMDAYADEKLLNNHPIVDHSYDFKLNNNINASISNQKAVPDKDAVVYMEYEIGKVEKDESVQNGLCVSGQPKALWPYQKDGGYMRYTGAKQLTQEGAKYLICFQKTADDLKVIVQKTLDGETTTTSYAAKVGTYNENYGYFSLFIAEVGRTTCEFKNFKCYDAKGNNLGVQFNNSAIYATHNGPIEDYSDAEAAYYCEELDSMIVLENDKKGYKEDAGVREEASYRIVNNQLGMSYADGKEAYDYTYLIITDDEGNEYRRLKPTRVTFVTGKKSFVKKANADNGYRIEQPDNPAKKGDTFVGWYLIDGTEYDFEKIVTESVTVYAKWKNGEGQEYLSTSNMLANSATTWLIVTGIIVVAAGSVTACIFIIRRRRKGKNA